MNPQIKNQSSNELMQLLSREEWRISKKDHKKLAKSKRIRHLRGHLMIDDKQFLKVKLKEIAFDISWGVFADQVVPIRELYSTNIKKAVELTAKLSIFCPTCVLDSMDIKCVSGYNKMVVLQYDNIDSAKYGYLFRKVISESSTFFACKTALGNGMMVWVLTNSHLHQHKSAFKNVADFYNRIMQMKANSIGQHANTFYPVTYDSYAYLNPIPEVIEYLTIVER